jgi:hypothetical protein
MLRALIYGLTLLHLGPGLAFALLAFGCDGQPPAIGPVCSMGVFEGFAWLTLGAWVVLGAGALAIELVGKVRRAPTPVPALRLAAFAALLVFGTLLGASLQALGGSQLAYLAIPTSLAAGWLFVANPQDCGCTPPAAPRRSSDPGVT